MCRERGGEEMPGRLRLMRDPIADDGPDGSPLPSRVLPRGSRCLCSSFSSRNRGAQQSAPGLAAASNNSQMPKPRQVVATKRCMDYPEISHDTHGLKTQLFPIIDQLADLYMSSCVLPWLNNGGVVGASLSALPSGDSGSHRCCRTRLATGRAAFVLRSRSNRPPYDRIGQCRSGVRRTTVRRFVRRTTTVRFGESKGKPGSVTRHIAYWPKTYRGKKVYGGPGWAFDGWQTSR